ncbi:hypothetical protein F4776DRAFT_614928 [Hypoxylon sp. NC0597]|nr:hypothetical protein F4776DRAFT_614928 [Hypoxylon sp. NC0597]
MTCYQNQSIFFRLPLELREEVYQHCQDFYMGCKELKFEGDSMDANKELQCQISCLPELLLTCKRIREEAEQWLYRDIDITYRDCGWWDCVWMYIYAVGKPDLSRVRMLTLSIEDALEKPILMFQMAEHIIDHAPGLQILEIEWHEMVYCPAGGVIELEDNIEPWFPILVKARNLRTLSLIKIRREWIAAVKKYLKKYKPEVKLEVEPYDVRTSRWARWN